MDRPVFFNFSTSQEITRYCSENVPRNVVPFTHALHTRSPYGIAPNIPAAPGLPLDGNHEGTNHILLFTVFNPMYPITVVNASVL